MRSARWSRPLFRAWRKCKGLHCSQWNKSLPLSHKSLVTHSSFIRRNNGPTTGLLNKAVKKARDDSKDLHLAKDWGRMMGGLGELLPLLPHLLLLLSVITCDILAQWIDRPVSQSLACYWCLVPAHTPLPPAPATPWQCKREPPVNRLAGKGRESPCS